MQELVAFATLAAATGWLTLRWARKKKARTCSGCAPASPGHNPPRPTSLEVLPPGA